MSVLLLALAGAAGPRAAGAQPGEPHGFVEPCTVGNVQEMDTDCELCDVSQGAANGCEQRLGAKGYQKKCRTHGTAAGFGEVWCTKRAGAAEAAASSEPKTQATTMWLMLSAAATAGLALFFGRRRAGRGTSS